MTGMGKSKEIANFDFRIQRVLDFLSDGRSCEMVGKTFLKLSVHVGLI